MFRLTIVFVIGLVFSSTLRADDAERVGVRFVTEVLRGKVIRDESLPGEPVVEVKLHSRKVTDANLKALAGFRSLKSLDLGNTNITDAGLKELAALKNLTSLNLSLTQVTDAGINELAALKKLTRLSLGDTALTDKAVKDLAALGHLTQLELCETKLTEGGFAALRKALPKCKITGGGK